MPITREAIEKRLAQAKEQLDINKQQLSAIQGVVADLEYWLAEDVKPVETKETEKEK